MSLLQRPQVVVLDIDDTLFLERDYARSGFAALSPFIENRLGIAGFGDICWSLFEQGARSTIFNRALERIEHAADMELIRELVAEYRTHFPKIELLEDARELIETVHGQMALAAVSDGPLAAQSQKVAALKLKRWLNPIILTDRWGREWWKPHPRAFAAIEEHFGLTGAALMYVGDNPTKDFIAPRALGWQTVRVRRDAGLNRDLEPEPIGKADHEVTDLRGLLRMLNDV